MHAGAHPAAHLPTHVVPEQGSVRGSRTREEARLSRVMPREHWLKVEPTVTPWGLSSSNKACLTWRIVNLGGCVPGQAAPEGALAATAGGERGRGPGGWLGSQGGQHQAVTGRFA